MKKQLHLTLLLSGALALTAAAQAPQHVTRCASAEYLQMQLDQNPQMRQAQDDIERFTQEYVANHTNERTQTVITVPVVFHVVYQNSAENIPDTRLLDQLQVLNEDFRALNSDVSNVPSAWTSLVGDMQINFCLAVRDPNGNATTGITRTQTSDASFSTDDQVKFTAQGGHDIWDRNKYLNLWICDLGGGLLGYSQFPGGAASTDGVVLNYRYVGTTGSSAPYNLGRTATHEIGHWFNLRHIWGDDGSSCSGSDQVSDTPNQASENYTCQSPGFVLTDACTTTSPGVMWMNYMDYTDDACMYMFTAGQATRAQAALLTSTRSGLATSNGCTPVSVEEQHLSNTLSIFPSPSTGLFTVNVGNSNTKQIDVNVFDMLGRQMNQQHFDVIRDKELKLDLRSLASGVYFIQVNNGSEKVLRKVMIER